VYVGRTYPALVPYLRGIHLTFYSWRPWRKSDGWKMTEVEIKHALGEGLGDLSQEDKKAPERVHWVPRLKNDVEALQLFTSSDQLPKRTIRLAESQAVSTVYTFGDASGSGFGGSTYDRGEVSYYSGHWNDSQSDQSSNHRELSNLILDLENKFNQGVLENTEVFVFTDNSTVEAAFFKGTSKSRLLFELILRLQFVHLHSGMMLHFVHVSGKRMIAQGTDGLSRGVRNEGVMKGENFLEYIPYI